MRERERKSACVSEGGSVWKGCEERSVGECTYRADRRTVHV